MATDLLKRWASRFTGLTVLKRYAKGLILGLTLAFVGQQLLVNAQGIRTLAITGQTYFLCGLALVLTSLAHAWAGIAWGWILQTLGYDRPPRWAMNTYLTTNLAKYLPGNIWHFYGRVRACQTVTIPLEAAVVSVVLEALLMASAALILALGSGVAWPWSALALLLMAGSLHPRCLNPVVTALSRSKQKQVTPALTETDTPPSPRTIAPLDPLDPNVLDPQPLEPASPTQGLLHGYPWKPLLGEVLFVLGRGGGFGLIVLGLVPLDVAQLGAIVSGFSVAWFLGLVVPGAPGGMGVFEASALILLGGTLPSNVVLASVALYRLISTLGEIIGAGLGLSHPLTRSS